MTRAAEIKISQYLTSYDREGQRQKDTFQRPFLQRSQSSRNRPQKGAQWNHHEGTG